MKNKKLRKPWIISLLAIIVITGLWIWSLFAGIDLPDWLVRTMGVLDLCAVIVLVFTSIRMKRQ